MSRTISGIGDALQEISVITIISLLSNSALVSGLIVALNALVRIICSIFAINKTEIKNYTKTLASFNYFYAFITAVFFLLLVVDSNFNLLTTSVVVYETVCSIVYTFYKIYHDVLIKEVSDSNEKIARLYTADNIIKVATSLFSTVLLLFMSYKGFLIMNAISFLISGYLISRLKLEIKNNNSRICTTMRFQIVNNVKKFHIEYPSVFKTIILSALLTFFFASYSIAFQKIIRVYSIDVKYIGMLNAIFYLLSITFSYIAGYVKMEKVKAVTFKILIIGIIISTLCISKNKWIVLTLLLFVYPLIGSGYNTIAQIYFQNKTNRDDIPILKGIYNIFCGLSVLGSGLMSPFLLNNLSLFYSGLIVLFALSLVFIKINFFNDNILTEAK